MQESLDYATWFWLLVPMLGVLALSVLTFFTDRRKGGRP